MRPEKRVAMTGSDCAVRTFHGKQGGQADILKVCVFVKEVYPRGLTFALWEEFVHKQNPSSP